MTHENSVPCPACGESIADPLSIIETDGVCPHCGTDCDELFDIGLDDTPDRSPEEVIDEAHALEVDA